MVLPKPKLVARTYRCAVRNQQASLDITIYRLMEGKPRQPEDRRLTIGASRPERTSWLAARVDGTGERIEIPLRQVLKKAGLIGGASIFVAASVLTVIGRVVTAPQGEPSLGPPPQSQVVDVTLPFGSTQMGGGATPGTEVWHVPLEASDEVANLRPQLPIWGPHGNLPWCSEISDTKRSATMWSWGTAEDMILIDVSPYYAKIGFRDTADAQLVTLAGSAVRISRGPDTGGVCDTQNLPADDIYADGTYVVGTDIQPGLWRSDGGADGLNCRWRRVGGGNDAVVASDFGTAQQAVRIAPSDAAFVTEHCQTWHKIE